MTPTAAQIAADILARKGGATEKQAAFIGRLLAPMLKRQARHGVPCGAALYNDWVSSAATKQGASETIQMLTTPQSCVRG